MSTTKKADTCVCELGKKALNKILNDAINGSNGGVMRCSKCFKDLELDDIADILKMNDEDYSKCSKLLAKQIVFKTKPCPHCKTEVNAPKQFVNDSYQVTCAACSTRSKHNTWCWLCGKKWKEIDFAISCGNIGCSTMSNNSALYPYNDHDNKETKANQDSFKDGSVSNDHSDDTDIHHDEKKKNNNQCTNTKQQQAPQAIMGLGLVGLENLGNTCFMNSALQCLLQCPTFVELFLYDKVKTPKKSNTSLTYIWSSFVKQVYKSNKGYIAPIDIKRALNRLRSSIGNGKQEDSFYVIQAFLHGLDDEICLNDDDIEYELDVFDINEMESKENINDIVENKIWGPYTQLSGNKKNKNKNKNNYSCCVRNIFDGAQCEILTCCNCQYQLRVFQTFRHIELPLFHKILIINIQLYIKLPEITITSIQLDLNVSCDNTMDGLKQIIFNKIKDKLEGNINNNIKIQIGFINGNNNNNRDNNVNEWFMCLKGTDGISAIPNNSQIYALICEKNDRFIPRFNLICTASDRWLRHSDGPMTFTKFCNSGKIVTGQKIIDYMKKETINEYNSNFAELDYKLTIYYNNKIVKPNDDKVTITNNGCLLLVWVHNNYNKQSPCLDYDDVKYEMNDGQIIYKAGALELTSVEGIIRKLGELYDNLSINWRPSNLLPQCILDQLKTQKEIDMEQAQKTREKLEKLSNAETRANKWLGMRLRGLNKNYQEKNKNITKAPLLNNVQDCLNVYQKQEISSANPLYCQGKCKDFVKMVGRKVDILKTPKILILHIGRDDDNSDEIYGKRHDLINYPLKGLIINNDKYDLFGVTVHFGYTTGFGHYIAYVKNWQNQQWYKMNDSKVTKLSNIDKVITNDATTLFYQKRL